MNEKLKAVAKSLAELSEAILALADETKEEVPIKEEIPIKLEDVRAVLADISRAGKTSEMKALLAQFGAKRLSEIPAEKYPALLAAAKEIANASRAI